MLTLFLKFSFSFQTFASHLILLRCIHKKEEKEKKHPKKLLNLHLNISIFLANQKYKRDDTQQEQSKQPRQKKTITNLSFQRNTYTNKKD